MNFTDLDLIRFATNVECLEGQFDTYGTFGHGFINNLNLGGPQPIGARQANLTEFTRPYLQEIALSEQVQAPARVFTVVSTLHGLNRTHAAVHVCWQAQSCSAPQWAAPLSQSLPRSSVTAKNKLALLHAHVLDRLSGYRCASPARARAMQCFPATLPTS